MEIDILSFILVKEKVNRMSDKYNKELEVKMRQALARLKDSRREEEEKQYKKHWGEIEIPFTLDEVLNNFRKYELDEIRKNLEIKNVSSLKKAELIDVLKEAIPANLENTCSLWDNERFKLLTNIASNGGQLTAPNQNFEAEQINFFRATGMIYTGTFKGKKILAVPEELIEPIITQKNNLSIRATVKRNTEWMKLTRGLLYYYGTLSSTQLVKMLEKYLKDEINSLELYRVIQNANSYRKEIHIDKEGFSNIRVFDPKRVKQEHDARKNIDYYPFTKQQLLTAGEVGFVERNESYVELVNFLTQNFEINKEDADGYVEECVHATKIGDGPNDVLTFLSHTFEMNSMETVQALMGKVTYLMNNTREWFLKGYTSTELFQEEKKYLQPLPEFEQSKKIVKVGRNDPCPCGSGRKYKKCCGK